MIFELILAIALAESADIPATQKEAVMMESCVNSVNALIEYGLIRVTEYDNISEEAISEACTEILFKGEVK
jgi:hypothetical protein